MKEWQHAGLDCGLLNGRHGSTQGYIAVRQGHPLHGKTEGQIASEHGTALPRFKYAGDLHEDGRWWLGFTIAPARVNPPEGECRQEIDFIADRLAMFGRDAQ